MQNYTAITTIRRKAINFRPFFFFYLRIAELTQNKLLRNLNTLRYGGIKDEYFGLCDFSVYRWCIHQVWCLCAESRNLYAMGAHEKDMNS